MTLACLASQSCTELGPSNNLHQHGLNLSQQLCVGLSVFHRNCLFMLCQGCILCIPSFSVLTCLELVKKLVVVVGGVVCKSILVFSLAEAEQKLITEIISPMQCSRCGAHINQVNHRWCFPLLYLDHLSQQAPSYSQHHPEVSNRGQIIPSPAYCHLTSPQLI